LQWEIDSSGLKWKEKHWDFQLSDGGVKDVGLDVIGLADRLAVGD